MSDTEESATGKGKDFGWHRGKSNETANAFGPDISSIDKVLPESYRSCLDAIPDLMALKGGELEYLFVNKAFSETVAKSQSDVLGKRAIDIFPKDIARKLETMDLLVLASLETAIEEVAIDGRIYEMRKFPVNLHDRGLVVISGRDITERRESEATLLTEKIRFQIISDNAPVAMILLDEQGAAKYVNARFKDVLRYDLDDVPDGTTWFGKAFPDSDYETVLSSVISRPDEVSGWKRKEHSALTAVRRDGTRCLVSLEATQLVSGDVVVSCEELSQRLEKEARAITEADHDPLTGLPNRASLERATRITVARARESRKRRALSALLFLSIDGFDDLKRTYGAESMDEVLATFARLLKSILREGDIAYRSGEDRFAVVFKGISKAEARLAAERVQHSLGTFTFFIGSRDVLLTVVVALVAVEGAQDAAAVIAVGETTVEEAKITDLNRGLVYEPD